MVHYKLSYFPGRGAAEPARQIFALAGQEYEDVRIPKEEWPQHKDKMPFGQMPVLEEDGRQLAQSMAITRYLARKFGFAGKNAWDEATVDSLADQWKDFMTEFRPYFAVVMGFAEGDVEALKKDVGIPAIKKVLDITSKYLQKNPSGFLVGDSVTYVDLIVAEILSTIGAKVPEVYKDHPQFLAHKEKVHAIPALAKWIAARPDSAF